MGCTKTSVEFWSKKGFYYLYMYLQYCYKVTIHTAKVLRFNTSFYDSDLLMCHRFGVSTVLSTNLLHVFANISPCNNAIIV